MNWIILNVHVEKTEEDQMEVDRLKDINNTFVLYQVLMIHSQFYSYQDNFYGCNSCQNLHMKITGI